MNLTNRRSITALIAVCLFASSQTLCAQFSDGFESYLPGDIHGQGGWEDFGGTLLTEVSGDLAHSGSYSMKQTLNPSDPNPFGIPGYGSDVFFELPFPITTGKYELSYWMYVPTAFDGAAISYMAEGLVGSPEFDFGPQVAADGSIGFEDFSHSFDGGATIDGFVPLVRDEWVKFEALVDLDANSAEYHYDGSMVYAGMLDSDLSSGAAGASIGTLNLWVQGGSGGAVYYDDMSIQQIPEPNAMILAMLGIIGFLAKIRRKP